MDLTTLLGIFLGVATLVWAIMSESSLSLFWDIPSILVVLGGTIAATLVSHPIDQLRRILPLLQVAFVRTVIGPEEVIPQLVHFAEKARREGLLAMEEEAAQVEDKFLRKGIQLVVDGVDPELVRNVLEIETNFVAERHEVGQRLFQTLGAYAPAFGMIGTLIGLIQMLADLTDSETIGSGMALALITTLYGALLANLVFLPIAAKLKEKSAQEQLIRDVMIEGILSIQAGENPRIVEEKLKAFMSHADNAAQRDAQEAAGRAAVPDVR